MPMAVQVSSSQPMTTRVSDVVISDKVLGLALASLLPALFWTAVYGLVGSALGQAPAAATLFTIGFSIAAFLAVVVGSLMARQS